MKLTLPEIAALTGGTLQAADQVDLAIPLTEVVVDSRQLAGPRALFVALRGPHFDGHDFVNRAFESGAVAALVEHNRERSKERAYSGPVIVVDDTLKALQTLAGKWRQRFEIPVVGITGSNGKTIVKDMLASILGRTRTVYRSPGSYNSQVGVALSLLGIGPEHEVAIIEAGISQTDEMPTLEAMIRPTHGIITNIGLAHAAGLGTLETTAQEKSKLFARCTGPVVLPDNEPRLDHLFHVKRITLGESSGAQSLVHDIHPREEGFAFRLKLPENEPENQPENQNQHTFFLDLPGRHNVFNAAMAATMAAQLGADAQSIADGLGAYSLREMRLEMHTTGADITLINDTYNADPTSVRAALSVLERYSGRQRRIAILGDMLDLGTRSEEAHLDIGRHIARHKLDRLFCIGELAGFIGRGAERAGMDPEQIETLQDFDALHERLEETLQPGDVVLFKASRSIGLDRAAKRLIESVAPTRLFIDLQAIRHNFHTLRQSLGRQVKLMAVVKSFGYGNDATRISQTLIQEGVDALAVAFPDEAIPLRRRGLTIPILVTNPRAAEADKIVKYDLDALVYTVPVAEALSRQAERRKKVVGVHLEVDTGMGRAGLRPEEVAAFAEEVSAMGSLKITGLMTHFAVADVASEDAFTRRQIALFQQALNDVRARGIEVPLAHAANTAAAWRFPEARFDMVRVGLGLYGLHPSKDVAESARQVVPTLRFTTRVLHIHDVAAGDTVGYGRTWRADGPRRLATIAAGYNDGLPRFLSNRGAVLINGERCPIVGTICMDVSVCDITDAGPVSVGDEVVLFGEQNGQALSVDEWAELGQTINYELLCNISPRVRRIFLR